MKTAHTLSLSAAVMLILSACASTPTEASADKLARYESFAGAPVSSTGHYGSNSPMFDVVDDQHLLLTPRPSQAYLLKLSGPCLAHTSGSPSLVIKSNVPGQLSVNFDRIGSLREPRLSCAITEIRPVDIKALRAAEKAVASI